MKTSIEWWNETKANDAELINWLRNQYHGEVTAAERIERYCTAKLSEDDKRRAILKMIAAQERQHSRWVGDLLKARNAMPEILTKSERYWEIVLNKIESFEDAAGIAHHAETMRLERIRVIAEDETAPEDIRAVFSKILKDELFHAKAFASLAGKEAIEKLKPSHLKGTEAIGFISEKDM